MKMCVATIGAHHAGKGAPEYVRFDIVRAHVKKLHDQQEHSDANIRMNIATGATWPQARRFEKGMTGASPICPRCGSQEEPLWHRYYGCPCNKDDKDIESTNFLINKSKHFAEQHQLLWFRGIPSFESMNIPLPPEKCQVQQNR